ncbi:MAG: SPFH domain-containing protein [Gemmataceae bacterium]
MFGIRYFKAAPTSYVLQYVGGRVKREGVGLSFFYFAPSTTLVAVPVGSTDVPFIFQETAADFQAVTVQGHLTYRVTDARKLAGLLDYSVNARGEYLSDDPDKLPVRVTHAAQTAVRAEVQSRPLRAVLLEADAIAARVQATLARSPAVAAGGRGVRLRGAGDQAGAGDGQGAGGGGTRTAAARGGRRHLQPAQQRRRAGADDSRE